MTPSPLLAKIDVMDSMIEKFIKEHNHEEHKHGDVN